MFLGINMFLALLRAHLNPRNARAKMILSLGKNIFMPANVNSIVILVTIALCLDVMYSGENDICGVMKTLIGRGAEQNANI